MTSWVILHDPEIEQIVMHYLECNVGIERADAQRHFKSAQSADHKLYKHS